MSLSLPDLDSHLFKCADIIRDAVDPTDYKEFILPLVYYKAISDEYEKQYKKNLKKYGEEDLARRPNLYDVPVVPEGYLWDDLRSVSDNVDQALNEAFEAIKEENPEELSGVFDGVDYIEPDALDDDRLGKLVEHLNTYDLDRDSIPPGYARRGVHGSRPSVCRGRREVGRPVLHSPAHRQPLCTARRRL
ncbi:type I restriction-modification system subunit M N-terminal domain-containing protein [Halorubrum ezzemoulense]|nr:type I restriction-modification system subunit M N-terminal domain-containing protein [Halorubrum ezzemoulense]MDB2261832.1 type I restriction-modification system subunit M N-terminal domain-containing protein [Halorubrum ezzemoulense]MDB2268715.1 type I restriction-modification system subunit M N-terminal domain-containing protein [Halorubrum ezzemoulense]